MLPARTVASAIVLQEDIQCLMPASDMKRCIDVAINAFGFLKFVKFTGGDCMLIRNGVILRAKRLLYHTNLTVKEEDMSIIRDFVSAFVARPKIAF